MKTSRTTKGDIQGWTVKKERRDVVPNVPNGQGDRSEWQKWTKPCTLCPEETEIRKEEDN